MEVLRNDETKELTIPAEAFAKLGRFPGSTLKQPGVRPRQPAWCRNAVLDVLKVDPSVLISWADWYHPGGFPRGCRAYRYQTILGLNSTRRCSLIAMLVARAMTASAMATLGLHLTSPLPGLRIHQAQCSISSR